MTRASGGDASLVPASGGVLVVDKPVGPTSHDVVSRARRALSDRRIGHTGTLDPLASGVLVLCAGPATRLAQFLVGADKSYVATIRLGVATDSLDADGAVVAEDEAWRGLDEAIIRDAAAAMVGSHDQRPPAFSAKKVDGERAHRMARRGEEVELAPVPVTIHRLDLVNARLPDLDVEVDVSSGTFVRSLARDLGAALGTSAHITSLRRTRAGAFDVGQATPLDALEMDPTSAAWVAPLDAVAHLTPVRLAADEAYRLALGRRLGSDLPEGTVRVEFEGELLAVAEVVRGALRPRKVFMSPEAVAR